ncbi:MAG: hypothetical protein ABH842_05000 [Candidatus Micrarchaeota archaeon]
MMIKTSAGIAQRKMPIPKIEPPSLRRPRLVGAMYHPSQLVEFIHHPVQIPRLIEPGHHTLQKPKKQKTVWISPRAACGGIYTYGKRARVWTYADRATGGMKHNYYVEQRKTTPLFDKLGQNETGVSTKKETAAQEQVEIVGYETHGNLIQLLYAGPNRQHAHAEHGNQEKHSSHNEQHHAQDREPHIGHHHDEQGHQHGESHHDNHEHGSHHAHEEHHSHEGTVFEADAHLHPGHSRLVGGFWHGGHGNTHHEEHHGSHHTNEGHRSEHHHEGNHGEHHSTHRHIEGHHAHVEHHDHHSHGGHHEGAVFEADAHLHPGHSRLVGGFWHGGHGNTHHEEHHPLHEGPMGHNENHQNTHQHETAPVWSDPKKVVQLKVTSAAAHPE